MKSKTFPISVNHEAIEAAAAAWIAKQDNVAAWTPIDDEALQAWLGEHFAHRVAWLRLKKAWQHAEALKDAPHGDDIKPDSPSPPRVKTIVERRDWTRRRLHGLSIGLTLAFVVVTSGVVAWRHTGTRPETFATAIGAKQKVALADGSLVTLNTRTRARAVITPDSREFWLDQGEAFFEIAHDAKHPFVVTAGNDRVTVLGTKFSVRHEGDRTLVTVLEGRVRLDQGVGGQTEPESEPTILVRNDSAVAQKGSVLVATKTPEETSEDLSWRSGRLEFNNRPLSQIVAEFNRYNRQQLSVDPSAESVRLSGHFDMYNVEGFLRLLHDAFGVEAKVDGDHVLLTAR